MDIDQQKVYKKMQTAAVASMILFAIGLSALSYWTQQKENASHLNYSKSSDLSKWPKEALVQPLPSGYTLVSFWAAWCKPCLDEIPEMQAFVESLPEVQLIFVNTDSKDSESYKTAKEFAGRQISHQTRSEFDTEQKMKSLLKLTGIPTHYLLDSESNVLWSAHGQIDWKQDKVRSLFSEIFMVEQQIVQEPIEN